MQDIEIKLLNQDTIAQQIHIWCLSFGHDESDPTTREYWIQKHYANPIKNSFIFAAYIGNTIVGMNAFMPMRYRYQGNLLNILQSCESGVDPNYRRLGIWGKIIEFAMQYFKDNTDYDAIIGFPNYKNSYNGFLKHGWETAQNMRNFVLINNGAAIAEKKVPKAFAVFGKLLEAQKIPVLFAGARKKRGFTIREEQELSGITAEEQDRIVLYADSDWMAWKKRLKNQSYYTVYRFVEPIASFILEHHVLSNGLSCINIVTGKSYTSRKEYFLALAALLKRISNTEKAALIRTWCMADALEYKKLGFVEAKLHDNPFIVFALKQNTQYLMERSSAWDVGYYDLD